jgi:hypothetical protein
MQHYYVILDSTANLVASFNDEREARAELERIGHADPASADEYALLIYDEQGHVVADVVTAADLGVHA